MNLLFKKKNLFISILLIYFISLLRNKPLENHMYKSYIKMQKLMNHFNLKYVAIGGTLIGTVRDSKFISFDYDMDFCTDINNKDIIFSNEFKKVQKKLNLDIEYYHNNPKWAGIGGLKLADKNKWDYGQIDLFFMSNAIDKEIYYIGNDGKPHNNWDKENYKKKNLFPLVNLPMKFPTINKTVLIPCPNKYHLECKNQWGNYMKPPNEYALHYYIDQIIFK